MAMYSRAGALAALPRPVIRVPSLFCSVKRSLWYSGTLECKATGSAYEIG